jgi:hypothetical protein
VNFEIAEVIHVGNMATDIVLQHHSILDSLHTHPSTPV